MFIPRTPVTAQVSGMGKRVWVKGHGDFFPLKTLNSNLTVGVTDYKHLSSMLSFKDMHEVNR